MRILFLVFVYRIQMEINRLQLSSKNYQYAGNNYFTFLLFPRVPPWITSCISLQLPYYMTSVPACHMTRQSHRLCFSSQPYMISEGLLMELGFMVMNAGVCQEHHWNENRKEGLLFQMWEFRMPMIHVCILGAYWASEIPRTFVSLRTLMHRGMARHVSVFWCPEESSGLRSVFRIALQAEPD